MSMKLYVGNLSFGTMKMISSDSFLKSARSNRSWVTDRDTGRSRGFAFVEMSSQSEGEAAIAKFNGSELDGRSLTVSEAKPRETSGGGFGGGHNGGRGGGFGRGRGSARSRY